MRSIRKLQTFIYLNLLAFAICGFTQDTVLNEFCIHPTTTSGTQQTGRLAQLANFSITAVWQNASGTAGIYGKVYSSDMKTVLVNDFLINSTSNTVTPTVTALSNGNFVVSWIASYSSLNMAFNIYTSAGVKVLGADIVVNSVNKVQTTPIVIPLQNMFVTVIEMTDIYGKIYNNNGSVAVALTKLNAGTDACYVPSATSLTNGNWAATWVIKGSGNNYDIYARIFDATGNPVTSIVTGKNTEWLVNTVTANDQKNPSISSLRNNKFVVTWTDYSVSTKGRIMAQVYNNDGGLDGVNFQVNVTNASATYDQSWVSGLTYSGFIVTWMMKVDTTVENVWVQIYDRYYNKVGSEFMLNKNTANIQNYATALVLNNNSFVVAFNTSYTGDINVNAVMYNYNSVLTCNSFSITANLNTPVTLGFTSNILHEFLLPSEMYVMVKSASAIGQVYDLNSNAVAVNNKFSSMGDSYLSNQANSGTTFTYVSADNTATSSTCTVTVNFTISCFSLCSTCSGTGDSITNNCATCVANYYAKEDSVVNCYPNTTILSNYYYSNQLFRKCYSSCYQCTSLGVAMNMLCTSCLNNYYPLEDNTAQCYLNSDMITNYYFNSNKFSRCMINCKYCTGLGISSNHLCTTCADNYYPLIDNPSNCYTSNTTLGSYYFSTNQFNKCYVSCGACPGSGTTTNHNCSACATGYYALEDNSTFCYQSTQAVQYYYFDSNTNIFKRCNPSCTICNNPNNCLTCNTSYYSLEDNSTSCHQNTEIIQNYLYASTQSKFLKCYSSCQQCSGQGNQTTHLCTICGTNYYPLQDDSSQCYLSTDIITGFYFSTNTFKITCMAQCATCGRYGTDADNKCITCATGFSPLEDKASQCYTNGSAVPGYYFDNTIYRHCYASCATCNIQGDSINNNCLTCTTGYFPLEDRASQCIANGSVVPKYYFNTNIYHLCYSSCGTCNIQGDISANNCLSCASGSYPLQDNSSMCFPASQTVNKYFWDATNSRYSNCYSSCLTCSTLGNSSDSKCIVCNSGYFPLEDQKSQCISSNTQLDFYYFNQSGALYSRCYTTCKTCNTAGTLATNNCLTCANGNYSMEDNATQCYPPDSTVNRYYLDINNLRYSKCYSSCATCSIYGDASTNNCSSCLPNYYRLENNNSQCLVKNLSINNYFWDETNQRFSSCYTSCLTCSKAGTALQNNCTSCNAGFFPLQDDNSQCLSNASVDHYYWDSTNSRYSSCYSSCLSCNQSGSLNKHNCLTCDANFYPLKDDSTMCYSPNVQMDYYFWDSANMRYTNCFSSCKTCNSLGNSATNNCSTCNDNYYPLPDQSSQCYPSNTLMNYYFWDTAKNNYVKCYQSCQTCSALGDANYTKCLSCNSGYYPLPDNSSQCYLPNLIVDGYFWDSANTKYTKCYTTCSKCTSLGNSIGNQCQACAINYFPLPDNTSQCFPSNTTMNYYFWDAQNTIYTKCYQACKSCSSLGALNDSKCTTCDTGYYPLPDNHAQCYSANTSLNYYF
jgi:hypothetical protein